MSKQKNPDRALKRAQEAALPKRYSIGEEIFSSITHGVGAGLSIAALVLLIVRAVAIAPATERGFYITAFTIFGSTLIVLYLMSTLYHALTPYGVKKVFAIFDHVAIYLLIAGTYTPYCLLTLRQTCAWALFGIIWGLAVLGITLYAVFGSKLRFASAITYLLMSWLVLFAIKQLYHNMPHDSFVFFLAGGFSYSIGFIFYSLKKIKWMHCVWHLFVLGGSICHFFSIFFLIK